MCKHVVGPQLLYICGIQDMMRMCIPIVLSLLHKCMTLGGGKPDRVHVQNMEQLHLYDCHQNVAETQATEYQTCVHGN